MTKVTFEKFHRQQSFIYSNISVRQRYTVNFKTGKLFFFKIWSWIAKYILCILTWNSILGKYKKINLHSIYSLRSRNSSRKNRIRAESRNILYQHKNLIKLSRKVCKMAEHKFLIYIYEEVKLFSPILCMETQCYWNILS